jgi:AcrR family transcriptional regulator
MPANAPGVRVGGADLGRHRHVCGLFEGPEAAAEVLLPFVVDSLARGDRVIHIVEDREAYLQGLALRTDASAAVESGQLDVRTWDMSYLSTGRFNGSRMLTFIRRSLREGWSLGFHATRLLGEMEWAQGDVPGVEELIDYEIGLNALVARPDVTLVCAYDVRRHSASRITQILGAHQAALVGGRLQPIATPGGAASPKERILEAASLLFAENGVNRTGVDTLIAAAGVAKATFYRQFPSKEALVVAWLQDRRTRWFERVRAQVEARATTPDEQVPRLFEAVAEWLAGDDFVGCPYLNTAIEVSDPTDSVSRTIRDTLAEIERYLQSVVAATGHPDPPRLGKDLQALLAGSIMLGVANRTTAHVLAARDAAERLLAVPQD